MLNACEGILEDLVKDIAVLMKATVGEQRNEVIPKVKPLMLLRSDFLLCQMQEHFQLFPLKKLKTFFFFLIMSSIMILQFVFVVVVCGFGKDRRYRMSSGTGDLEKSKPS